MAGGALAGVALLLQGAQTRRTLALYSFVRLLQCMYCAAKRRGLVQPVKHGDAIIFGLSSAQIMYVITLTEFGHWQIASARFLTHRCFQVFLGNAPRYVASFFLQVHFKNRVFSPIIVP